MNLDNKRPLKTAQTLEEALDNSFLQPWIYKGPKIVVKGQSYLLADFAFLYGSRLVLFSEHNMNFTTTQDAKQYLSATQQRVTKKITNAYKTNMSYVVKNQINTIFDVDNTEIKLPDIVVFSFMFVSKIGLVHQEKFMHIKHGFSSDFYAENESVFSMQVEHPLQCFSLKNFVKTLTTLNTTTDFLDFLDYSRNKIIDKKVFENETKLLTEYIAMGSVFDRSRDIDATLVENKLRPQGIKTLEKTELNQQISHFKNIKEKSKFWQPIVETMYAQIAQQGQFNDITKQMFEALSSECIFSRYILSSCIADYYRVSAEQQNNGYVVQMRSYTHILRHYVFFFYGLDPASSNHRSLASKRLQGVADNINSHFQSPPLQQLVIIGLERNEYGFDMDMHFQKGKKIVEGSNQFEAKF